MSAPKHFLDLDRLDGTVLRGILDRAAALKRDGRSHQRLLEGRTLAMIFEKPSTRTRVSFEVGVHQMGGQAIMLSARDMQLGRGETVADTARVLSRFVDAIMIRTHGHQTLMELAAHATVPVINGLTDYSHPCQVMADVMTFEEHRGPIRDRIVAWSGDATNVATSFVHAAIRFDFRLRLACPEPLAPRPELIAWARAHQGRVEVLSDPRAAVAGADCVVTDTWFSMGQDGDDERRRLLEPYRVDDALMALADRNALFMHCLPAHRGEEVTDPVLDGPHSVVLDEAENRLHAQKGILAWCMLDDATAGLR